MRDKGDKECLKKINSEECGKLIEETQDEWRTLIMPADTTIEGLLADCKKLFPLWRYNDNDLDKLITSDRDRKKSYIFKVRNVIEADEQYKSMNAETLKEKEVQGITLAERLLLELDHFKETGEHLDIKNITLCSGSRDSDGFVPMVYWRDRKLFVDWCNPGYACGDLRTREVILENL